MLESIVCIQAIGVLIVLRITNVQYCLQDYLTKGKNLTTFLTKEHLSLFSQKGNAHNHGV
jgi:hypothetical protein